MTDKTTHFGYREVPEGEKARRVRDVFRSVAPSYDTMNDLMSLGLHRVWKFFTIGQAKAAIALCLRHCHNWYGPVTPAASAIISIDDGRPIPDRWHRTTLDQAGSTPSMNMIARI